MTPLTDVALGTQGRDVWGRRSTTSNCRSGRDADSEAAAAALLLTGCNQHRCRPRDLSPLDVVQLPLSEGGSSLKSSEVLRPTLHCDCRRLSVATLLGCGSRDMPYLHLSLPFIALTLYV